MESLLTWRIWTEFPLPVMSAGLGVVYLTVGGLLGFLTALFAHRAWRASDHDPWRRLRYVGSAQATVFWLRALLRGTVVEPNEILAAAFSLVDLGLLAMAMAACRSLWSGREDARWRNLLQVFVSIAIFGGMLGGDLHQPLMARNTPTAAAHLIVLAFLFVMMQWTFLRDLRRQRNEAKSRNRTLLGELKALEAEVEKLAQDRTETRRELELDRENARDAIKRTRLLEQLLAGAVELPARREESDLQECVVDLVRGLFGFQEVVFYHWSDTLDVFEAQTALGLDVEMLRGRAAAQMDRARYEQLVHLRFRISDSYLVPPDALSRKPAATRMPVVPADEARWPEGQRLIVPVTDPVGTVHGFLDLDRPESGCAPDLLRIRYLELFARQYASVLEGLRTRDRLAGSRAELALAADRLQTLGDLRSNFVANVSHELRTPLTSIIGYAEMLRERGEDMTSDMRREFVSVIHQEGLKFKEIVNDLLDLDRMEDGAGRIEGSECDLAVLMRRLAEDWRQRAGSNEQHLTVECDRSSIMLEADPLLCQQLLNHLLDNAFKFTPADGRISVRLSEQGTAVRLEVEDSGIGIPEEKLHAVFEQFFQIDGSSTREKGGQGVGLAICQDIVSWHDGRIWAENVPAGGTRMTVLLPRRPHVVLPEPPEAAPPVFLEPRLFLQRLVHWVGENLGVRTVVLLLADDAGGQLRILGATGLPAGRLEGLYLASGVGLAGHVWRDGRTRLEAPEPGDILLTGDSPALCVPLNGEKGTRGVIIARDRLDERPLCDDDRLLLESMASRIVHMMDRYEAHDRQSRDFAAIQSSLRMTTRVGALPHTDVASVCQEICLATARHLGLAQDDIRHLAFALQYYDVGLGSVPPYLLNKAGSLADEERALLERHVHAGLITLAPLKPPSKVRQIILHHHENFDGTGYPRGLAGEAIPLGSRLVALHDSLRALLQHRPWRPAVPWADALAEIQSLAGTRYCPRLTAVFLKEAACRRALIEDLRQRADDGEDLRRPAPQHPLQPMRV